MKILKPKILFEHNFHDANILSFGFENDKKLIFTVVIDYYDFENNQSTFKLEYLDVQDYNIKITNDGQYQPEIENHIIKKVGKIYFQTFELHGGGLISLKFKKVKIIQTISSAKN